MSSSLLPGFPPLVNGLSRLCLAGLFQSLDSVCVPPSAYYSGPGMEGKHMSYSEPTQHPSVIPQIEQAKN